MSTEPDRLAALEARISALEHTIEQLRGVRTLPTSKPPRAAPTPRKPFIDPDPGLWLNRLGIVLLLFGVAFAFDYSIDRGWIRPPFRVAMGLGLAGTLLFLSARVRARRPGLAQLLAGGGIVSAYISIYAAFQVFGLVPRGVAFVAISAVTALAFAMSMRERRAAMSVLAVVGGLLTPIVLLEGDTPGTVGYACIVLAGAAAVFLRRGWPVLLWSAALGGWLVFGSLAISNGKPHVWVQAGIVCLALCTWGAAVFRDLRMATADGRLWSRQLIYTTPLLVLAATNSLWDLGRDSSGFVALALSALVGLIAVTLWSSARRLAHSHAVIGTILLAVGIALLLDGNARIVALSLQALAHLALARRGIGWTSAWQAHTMFGLLTVVFLIDSAAATAPGQRTAMPASESLSYLVLIAGLAMGAFWQHQIRRIVYAVAAQVLMLFWFLAAFRTLPNAAAWSTAGWFLNAVTLLVVGLVQDSVLLRRIAAAVLVVTVAKLFLFDLVMIGSGWRIVTFLAFGAVLLGLGYAFPNLWRHRESS